MKNCLLFCLFLALVLALPATASLKQSLMFPTNTRLDSTVSLVDGKPSHVFCYNGDAEWNSRVNVAFKGRYTGNQINAFTFVGTSETEVSPLVCRTVFYALRVGQAKVTLYPLARAVNVLAHEPQHMYGIQNESQAESCGQRYYALVAHTLFGIQYHTARMREVVNAALFYSATLPFDYQGGSCPR